MKTIFAVALFAIVAVVCANPYSQAVNDAANTLDSRPADYFKPANTLSKKANTLVLQDTYGSLYPVVQIVNAQIQALSQAIADLNEAVNQAKNARDAAQNRLNSATSSEASARTQRDNAQQTVNQRTTELANANAALDAAEKRLADAITATSNAESDYKKKDGAWKTAKNIYEVESAFKNNEIANFNAILALFGQQNQRV